MPIRIRNYMKFFVAAFLLVSFCLVEADAQTRTKTHAAHDRQAGGAQTGDYEPADRASKRNDRADPGYQAT